MRTGSYSLVFVDTKKHKKVVGPFRPLYEIDGQVMETKSNSVEDLCTFISSHSTIPIKPDDAYILYRDGETEERLEICLQKDELVSKLLQDVTYDEKYGWRIKENSDTGVISQLYTIYEWYWKSDEKFKLLIFSYLDLNLGKLTEACLDDHNYSFDAIFACLYDYHVARNLAIGIRRYNEKSLPSLPDLPSYEQLAESEEKNLMELLRDEPQLHDLVRKAITGDEEFSEEDQMELLVHLTHEGRIVLRKLLELIQMRNRQRNGFGSQLRGLGYYNNIGLFGSRPIR